MKKSISLSENQLKEFVDIANSNPTAEDVAIQFQKFIVTYETFRLGNGLSGNMSNVFETLVSMTDKHGRICRESKHTERKDSKKDWPKGLTMAATGYIVYLIMLLKYYGLVGEAMFEGMVEELNEAAKQHGRKGDI